MPVYVFGDGIDRLPLPGGSRTHAEKFAVEMLEQPSIEPTPITGH